MTIQEKVDKIKEFYNSGSIDSVLYVYFPSNNLFRDLYDTWWIDNKALEYSDSKEGILLINLLYKLTFK